MRGNSVSCTYIKTIHHFELIHNYQKINISWIRTWVSITLFNELGDAYEKTLVENDDNEMVIAISAAKIHKFDGILHYTTEHTQLNVYH